MDKIQLPSNRNFGIVFFFFFQIISLYPLLNGEGIRWWSFIISLLFLGLGLKNSNILSPLNKIWFKFGILLGNIVSPIIMATIFFGVITPISVLMKIINKDVLNLKKNNKNSYWIIKDSKKSSMKDQF